MIVIPNSVTSIGSYAFSHCSGLSSITIPNSVTRIGYCAFDWCLDLTSILVAEGNSNYDSRDGCNAIIESASNTLIVGCKNTTIPNSVTRIGEYAFSGCIGLTNISIPNSVTSIRFKAFEYCSGLASITIPNSVTSIGGEAFDGTAWYNNQPDGVVYAGKVAYEYKGTMPSNTNIVLEEGTVGIANYAFANCSDLTSVTIPNSVTSIDEYAFAWCSGLTSVTIPNSVTTIQACVFYGCSNLTSITVPNSVTSVGNSAFYGTAWYNNQPDGLVYAGKVAYKYKGAMPSNTHIVLEKGTLGIADCAFHSCSNLTSITIPNSVTSIEEKAFYGCPKLADVYCYTENVPKTESDAFTNSDIEDATLYVPEVAMEEYRTMVPWSNFQNIVSIESDGQLSVTIDNEGIATFCPSVDVDFISVSGVKAYIGSGFNRKTGVLTMTRVYDVPTGEGLLLKGEPGTYQIPSQQSYSIYSNLLKGVTTETNLSATTGGYANYVLGSGSNGTGFYRVPAEGTTLAAGRAYLTIPAETAASRSALRLAFDDEDEATAISDVERQDAGSAVYDLQGRRVEQPQRGLYIRNGKKVVIK